MFLAVDIGNSTVFLGLFDGPELVATHRVSSRLSSPRDLADACRPLFERGDIDAAAGAGLPEVFRSMGAVLDETFDVELLDLEARRDSLLLLDIEHPETVGLDRLLNAVAAVPACGSPLIIVDMGTATTVDVVDATGAFAGGLILPGFETAAEALYRAAPKLPRVPLERPARVIGRHTTAALQSGLLHGQAAMLGGLVHEVRRELGAEAPVLGTGGAAFHFAEGYGLFDRYEPALILHGIRLAASSL